MTHNYLSLPVTEVGIDAAATQGPCELWRHTLGHGGINEIPLPRRVIEGVKRLRPRLIRVFLQEHFEIYPEHGRFNWDKLDPYMDALARTGAKVVAAITIKPKVLYPKVDHATWQPNDVAEWQHVIFELTKRYSVEKPIVTYWEIGNETDIGESGGSPYLIKDSQAYGEYYRMTITPILKAYPAAKVGGPAIASAYDPLLRGFIDYCRRTDTQLNFISWHLYSNDPAQHAAGIEKAKSFLDGFPGLHPEMLITEWSKGFEYVPQTGVSVSIEDMAFEPRRAAITAASILSMLDTGLDWSFYYHIWDQVFYPDSAWPSFFSEHGLALMVRHWNEVPHRFGLFGVNGEIRPQYFVYEFLNRMGEERIAATSGSADVRVLATRSSKAVSALLINLNAQASQDRIVQLSYTHLRPGRKRLNLFRIDSEKRMHVPAASFELPPVEQRAVYAPASFQCQAYLPADSVALVSLEDIEISG